MRVRDGDRVINSACAGRRISPVLITPFTEFTEGRRYFNSTYYCANIRPICYAWLVFMQLTRDLFAITKFLFTFLTVYYRLRQRI